MEEVKKLLRSSRVSTSELAEVLETSHYGVDSLLYSGLKMMTLDQAERLASYLKKEHQIEASKEELQRMTYTFPQQSLTPQRYHTGELYVVLSERDLSDTRPTPSELATISGSTSHSMSEHTGISVQRIRRNDARLSLEELEKIADYSNSLIGCNLNALDISSRHVKVDMFKDYIN